MVSSFFPIFLTLNLELKIEKVGFFHNAKNHKLRFVNVEKIEKEINSLVTILNNNVTKKEGSIYMKKKHTLKEGRIEVFDLHTKIKTLGLSTPEIMKQMIVQEIRSNIDDSLNK